MESEILKCNVDLQIFNIWSKKGLQQRKVTHTQTSLSQDIPGRKACLIVGMRSKLRWRRNKSREQEGELWNWTGGYNSPRFQAMLQSYSNQIPKQTYRPMEQNREPRNKPRHLWSINIWQRRQEYKMGKRQSFQQVLLGNLDSCM